MLLLTLQIIIPIFLVVLIPVYWKNYGPQNFLWLSDVGLFLTLLAVLFKSPLLISMATVGILLVEVAWNVDYFIQLVSRRKMFGLADYMFDKKKSKFLRGLSLFHVFMPLIWIWYIYQWHYEPRGFPYQIILTTIIFILTYFLSDPKENINWVFIPRAWKLPIPNWAWLIFLIVGYPILIMWPMHLILKML